MTQIHPIIKIRLQYIINMDEYIPNLQIHQHSLLTRKVFSRHNLAAQLFFFVSLGSSWSSLHIHLQVTFIFKSSSSGSGSSLDLDHHHWISIITRSGSSSLNLDHHLIQIIITRFGSSLDLDHHCWICIITQSGSSRRHHNWI